MSMAEGTPVTHGQQEGRATPFYPGPDQMGFGALGVLDHQDLDGFSAPKIAPVPKPDLTNGAPLSGGSECVPIPVVTPSKNGHSNSVSQDVAPGKEEENFISKMMVIILVQTLDMTQ